MTMLLALVQRWIFVWYDVLLCAGIVVAVSHAGVFIFSLILSFGDEIRARERN